MYHGARSMKSPEARAARLKMLELPHIAPLVRYAADLEVRLGVEVPHFDPADGGIEARILFLKEKPGPKTSTKRPGFTGSGFISRDNDDFTAETTYRLMNEIGLDRRLTIMWNAIPGWNGQIKFTPEERQAGLAEVPNLIRLLPKLEVVVLVGKNAWKAEPLLSRNDLTIFRSYHPSRRVCNSYPEHWRSIPFVWANAAAELRKF